jgi:hypothetical protein
MRNANEERFEAGFPGHGRGVVISHDGHGNFSEREMTEPELEARAWALLITNSVDDLYRRGEAGVYHCVWEYVALAIADAVAAEQRKRAGGTRERGISRGDTPHLVQSEPGEHDRRGPSPERKMPDDDAPAS